MKRTLLFLSALLMAISGAWADPIVVTLANWNNDITTSFGSFNGYTFTTNSGSGLAGVTMTVPNSDITVGNPGKVTTGYGYCMKFVTSDTNEHTVQLSAPSGYVIESYTMALRSNSSNASFTVVAADGTTATSTIGAVNTSNSGYPFIHVKNVESQSTTLTMKSAQANTLYVPYFTIVVRPSSEVKNVNKTFIYHSYGTLADNTMTTNVYSGMEGVTVATVGLTFGDTWVNSTYGQCLSVTATDTKEHTMTITAPEGYVVRGYTMVLRSNQSADPATFTASNGTSKASTTGGATLVANNLTERSTTIRIKFTNNANTVYIPSFFVNIQKRVDAFTGISTDKRYNIYNNRGVWAVANGASVVNSTAELSLAFMASDRKQQFAFIPYNEKYYLYSVSAGKYAYVDGDKLSLTEFFTSEVAASPVTFATSKSANYAASAPVVVQVGGASFGVSTNFSPDIYKYSPHLDDDGNAAAIYEAADFDNTKALAQITNTTNVTYHLIYDNAEKDNVTTYALVGADLSIPSSLDTYCMTYKYYSDSECTSEITTVPNGGGDVYVVATWNGPVKFTTTTSAPEYYNLNIRSQYLVYDDAATGDVKLQATSEPFNPKASWAFIGDPYTGFKIINKTNGTDKYLTYTSVVTGNNHNVNNIQFIADAGFTDQYWYIDTNTGGFCLRMKANPDIYFHHDNSSKFLRTCSRSEYGAVHNDAGSTILASTDEEVLFDLYDSMKDWSFGTSIGQMNTTNEKTINNITAKNTMLGVGSVISSSTTAAYPEAYAALLQIKDNMALVEPTAGYYRLKNVATDKYLKATKLPEPEGYDDTHKYVYANGSSSEVGTVIQLKDENNKLYMYNQSYSFGWVVADKSHGAGVGYLTTIPDKYVHWFPGKAANQIAFAICYGNGTGDYASYLKEGIYTTDTDESVIAGTDYTTDAAQWKVEEATTITINNLNEVGAASYATLYVDFPVAIPEGNESTAIYTLSESKGVYTCNKQTSVRPGTGIIIRDISKASSVTLSIPSTYNEEVRSALTGSFLGTTAPSNCYIFSIGDEGLGFYPYASGSALAANKAYLVPNSDSGIRGFALSFNDTETGICETETFAKDSKLFDLQGRHIAKPQHGIYIVNGKKVLF